jgi:hypothetical protein
MLTMPAQNQATARELAEREDVERRARAILGRLAGVIAPGSLETIDDACLDLCRAFELRAPAIHLLPEVRGDLRDAVHEIAGVEPPRRRVQRRIASLIESLSRAVRALQAGAILHPKRYENLLKASAVRRISIEFPYQAIYFVRPEGIVVAAIVHGFVAERWVAMTGALVERDTRNLLMVGR